MKTNSWCTKFVESLKMDLNFYNLKLISPLFKAYLMFHARKRESFKDHEKREVGKQNINFTYAVKNRACIWKSFKNSMKVSF